MKTVFALLLAAVAVPSIAIAQIRTAETAEVVDAGDTGEAPTGGMCVVPPNDVVAITLNGVAYSCVPADAALLPTCGTGYGLGNDMCLCDYGDFTSIVDCPKHYIHDEGLDF